MKLVEVYGFNYFKKYIDAFSGLNSEVALELIKYNSSELFRTHIGKFKDIDLYTAKILYRKGYVTISIIKNNPPSFNFDVSQIEKLMQN